MIVEYPIPSHCELAVFLEQGIMLVFAPVTVPFRYKVEISDVDDFWSKYCGSCALRATICKKSGALSDGRCLANNEIKYETKVLTVQMPVPRHMLLFALYREDLKFAYEKQDGELTAMRLSNIYYDGRWCHGGVDYCAIDPNDIYHKYFGTVHNHDLNSKKDNYGSYIKSIATGGEIEEGIVFDPEYRWGATRHVVYQPSLIQWSDSQGEGFLKMEGQRYNYAKIS